MEKHLKIGIIYIATGAFCRFWNEFYLSCEALFCIDAEKGYEVFTDKPELWGPSRKGISIHPIENKGWVTNVSSKSAFICSIRERLQWEYDYVFFLNSNFKFIEPILCREILPTEIHHHFTVLAFTHYLKMDIDKYPYDRNEKCKAYIPYGEGKRYYQATFYGARTEEMLLFSDWSKEAIESDLGNGIVARFHDESYLNRYLLKSYPRVVNEQYGYSNYMHYPVAYKAVLLDKDEYLGIDIVRTKHVGLVWLSGDLGEQMFGFAFYCYLRKRFMNKGMYYIDPVAGYGANREADYQLKEIFKVDQSVELPRSLRLQIGTLPIDERDLIGEKSPFCLQSFTESNHPVAMYQGYWHCWQYAEECKDELKSIFEFDTSRLSESLVPFLYEIRHCNSVSVDIRRKQYLEDDKKLGYGGICTELYYRLAIERIHTIIGEECFFFLFTDDPEWISEKLEAKDSVIIDCSIEQESWQYMYLISECKHHITANNPLSWWGAWLGRNEQKQIIAPSLWSNIDDTLDIVPKSWIKRPTGMNYDLLQDIATHLVIKGCYIMNPGLFHGTTGLLIFFFHYARLTQNNWYRSYAEELLNEMYEKLNKDTPIQFSDGLCGIGWGIEYMARMGFVTGCTDEVLIEIDDRVMLHDPRRIEDISFETGLEGIACYVASRLNTHREDETYVPFDDVYLNDLKEACRIRGNISLDKEDYSPHKVMEKVLHSCSCEGNHASLYWQTGLNIILKNA